jgi:hypothetical protein
MGAGCSVGRWGLHAEQRAQRPVALQFFLLAPYKGL